MSPYRCPPAGCMRQAVALAATLAACGTSLAQTPPPDVVYVNVALTSFQSALALSGDGNGSVNGDPLPVDAGAGLYTDVYGAQFRQSATVALSGFDNVSFNQTVGGADNPNTIRFRGYRNIRVQPGTPFALGDIQFQNGFWFAYAKIGFTVTTTSPTNPALNQAFQGFINVQVSAPPTSTDPLENADYFFLTDAQGQPFTSLGSVRVYERDFQPPSAPGNVGDAVVDFSFVGASAPARARSAAVRFALVPTQFTDPTGGAFLSSSLDPVTAVPEPPAAWLMAAGLCLMGWGAARKRKTSGLA